MPGGTGERRPLTTDGATNPGEKFKSSLASRSDVPAELRGRRAASYRCQVLADGRRDPIDKPRKVRAVTVRIIGSRAITAEFAGPGVIDAFRTLGVRYMRARAGGAWWCSSAHAEDVMAILETRGYRVDPTL